MKRPFPLSWGQVARLVVLSLSGVIVLLPFVWGAAVSLKPPAEIWSGHFRYGRSSSMDWRIIGRRLPGYPWFAFC